MELDLMPMMLKRLTLTGSTLRSRPDAFKAAVARDLQARVWPLFEDGTLRTVTHGVFALAQAAEAAPEDGGRESTVARCCSRRDWEQARRVIGALKALGILR